MKKRAIFRYIFIFITSTMLLVRLVYAETNTSANANQPFEIIGVSGDLLKNIQSRLMIAREQYAKKLTQQDQQKLRQQAAEEVRKAIEPFGYFKPNIQIKDMLNPNSPQVAKIIIDKGPAIRINNLDIKISGPGEKNSKLMKYLRRSFPLKQGEIFDATQYAAAKEKIFQILSNQGYIKNSIEENKVLIDLKKYEVSIILHLQTGECFYMGKFSFSSSPYHETFLRKFIPYNEREPFSSNKLIQLQQQLAGSYYFKQVEIKPNFNQIENHSVPINVKVVAPKSQRYNFGLGYGTFTGPRFTAGLNLRRLTDTGQHLDAQLRLSTVLSGLAAKYYIPGRNPITDRWVIGANYQKFFPKNGESTSQSFSGGYLKKNHFTQLGANLNYLIERYSVLNATNQQILFTQTRHLLYPNFSLSYVKSDNIIHPANGKALNLMLQGSAEKMYSSTDFIQADLRGKYMFSPASFAKIITKGELGYTVVNDLNNLPLTLRFFAGGLNSLRGFPDSSIGPGKYLGLASVEYQNKIVGEWSAAAFYDLGIAANSFHTPSNRGVGVGIVYDSIIGPIKLYVAQAVSKRTKPNSIEFSIGPEF